MDFRGRAPEKEIGSAKCASISPRKDVVNISGGCLQTKKMKSDDDIKNDVDEGVEVRIPSSSPPIVQQEEEESSCSSQTHL